LIKELFIWFFVCFGFFANAQTNILLPAHGKDSAWKDSTIHLREAKIESSHLESFLTGSKIQTIEILKLNLFKQDNLGLLLNGYSSLSLKYYGPSGISTSSLRGGNASHTAVLWNGFNLQSAMHGQVDFSLIPSFFIDYANIQYGGNASLFGSGSVGGAVHLGNLPNFNAKNIELLSSFGSFSNRLVGLKIKYGSKKIASDTRVLWNKSLNNFEYYSDSALFKIKQRQQNAEFRQAAILQNIHYIINSKNLLSLNLWLQENLSQIPPVLGATNFHGNQTDRFTRINAQLKSVHQKYILIAKTALLSDYISYSDDVNSISRNKCISSITNIENYFQPGDAHEIQISFSYNQANANVDSYSKPVRQSRTAAFASYKLIIKSINLEQSISIRNEIKDGIFSPAIPSYGFSLTPRKNLKIFGNVSRNFRYPTLNDLYWINLGNPNLQPEIGWSQEIGSKISGNIRSFESSISLSVFNRNMKNLIVWLPNNSGLWRPDNVYKVWSRGIELDWSISKTAGDFSAGIAGKSSFLKSTNMETKNSNDISLGKQIIYVPRIKHIINAKLTFKEYQIEYSQVYTGISFTSSDNLFWLDDFNVGNLCVARYFKVKNYQLDFSFATYNIFNSDYQVVLNRPMPLRNFQFTINLKL